MTEGERASGNMNFIIEDTASISPSVSFADSSLVRGSQGAAARREALDEGASGRRDEGIPPYG